MATAEEVDAEAVREARRRLHIEERGLVDEIASTERVLSLHENGLLRLVDVPSEAALARKRTALADVRSRITDIDRELAEQQAAAEAAEAEAAAEAAARLERQIADAQQALLVARMAFDQAQARRLSAALAGDLDAYGQTVEASDTAQAEFNRAREALQRLED